MQKKIKASYANQHNTNFTCSQKYSVNKLQGNISAKNTDKDNKLESAMVNNGYPKIVKSYDF